MRWQQPVFDPSYSTLHDGHFINGGLIILKRHVAEKLNFNSLLLHNEAEDVELSFYLRSHGIIPRMNSYSSAVALGVPDSYTATFRNVINPVSIPSERLRRAIGSIFDIGVRWVPSKIKKSIGKTRLYAALIQYLRLN